MHNLQPLIQELCEARLALQIHNLRGQAISTRADSALAKLQAACPHTETVETSQYSSGGYDYTSSTSYQLHCQECELLLKAWEVNHGTYG
jgi:hypothetical protein